MARSRNMFASLLIGATLLGGGALANNAAAAPLSTPTLHAVAQSTPDTSPTANEPQCADEANNEAEKDTDNVEDETNSEDQGTNDTEESDSEDQGTNDTEDEDSADASGGEDQAQAESDSTDASENDTANQEDNADTSGEEDATAMSTPGTLSEGQELQADASITVEEAVTAAQGQASGTLGTVELEKRDQTLVYEVTIGDQEVFVDATTGEIVTTQPVDPQSSDCSNETEGTPGTLTDGQDLQPQAKVTLDEAIATATSETTGDLGTVELEKDGDTLVYVVKVGDQEVTIDASDGHVISVDQED